MDTAHEIPVLRFDPPGKRIYTEVPYFMVYLHHSATARAYGSAWIYRPSSEVQDSK